MKQSQNKNLTRRLAAYVAPFGINFIHNRKPWVVAFWSIMFPGYGHLMLCKYGLGFALIIWETGINAIAHINEAIFYTCTGQFALATRVLDRNWTIIYGGVYIFAIWDSYRRTINLNTDYEIARREGNSYLITNMSLLDLNSLHKREPVVAYLWSIIVPGLGELYLNRLVIAAYIVVWIILNIKLSNIMFAQHYTLLGDFAKAKAVLNVQWLLNWPSFYGYSCYDSYVNAVEYNRIYENEQASYLK